MPSAPDSTLRAIGNASPREETRKRRSHERENTTDCCCRPSASRHQHEADHCDRRSECSEKLRLPVSAAIGPVGHY